MTVQDAVSTVLVPRQAEPADAPLSPLPQQATASPAAATAPLLGRERPVTDDERLFLVAVNVMFVFLAAIIATFMVLAHYAWA